MTKLLLNYLLIYAIITVITAILILWRGRKDRDVILIIAGASALAILLFHLFYTPALNTVKLPPLSETMVGSAQTPQAQPPEQTQPEDPKGLPAPSEARQAGPFPTDETVTEKERQIGRLFNIWRQSVLTRNISQINQLDSQIKACGDEAIPFLTELAQSDGNERVRAFSVRVLGRMDIEALSSLFEKLLKNDTSPFVRENSCWALGRLGNPDALETLQKAADSDSSEPVRKAAEEAIKTIKTSGK